MLGTLRQHAGELRTACLYRQYPRLPLTEIPQIFRYKGENRNATNQNVNGIAGLEIRMATTRTISTTYNIGFEVENYVLIGSELWRIEEIAVEELVSQSARINKNEAKRFILTMNRVDNATNISK